MSPFRRMKVGRMVLEVMAWDLHVIVSHAKMVAHQVGQIKRVNHPSTRLITTASSHGPESGPFIKCLGSDICAPNFQKSRICFATSGFLNHALEQCGPDSTAPELRPDGHVVDVKLAGRLPRNDVAGDWSRLNGSRSRRSRDEHQFAIAALKFGVVGRPTPTTQTRLFLYFHDFEQIMLRHAHDDDVFQTSSWTLFGHGSKRKPSLLLYGWFGLRDLELIEPDGAEDGAGCFAVVSLEANDYGL